jgi:diacylglycerol kinase (ATP)
MEPGNKNNDVHQFSMKERLNSFSGAIRGIGVLIKNGHNFRIHLIVLVLVIVAGFLLKISAREWIAVILAAGLVLAAESLNTAIEYLSDRVSPVYDPAIRKVKDVSAAGVLISAVIAVITGVIIFLPRVIDLVESLR